MFEIKVLWIFILSALLAPLLQSCKKSNISFSEKADLIEAPIITMQAIPAFVFDWESSSHMPSMSNANLVPMPWNSGTTAIDPNIVADYKKVDGWELVWNTFSPTTQLNDPGYTYFFALYNKYRGILRFYLWQTASSVATTYVNHGLKSYSGSTNSSMLNFNAQDIIDPSNNQQQFNQVLNQQINSSGGTWFAFQYEMAYDPQVATKSFPDFGLEWTSNWASVSAISLNGTLAGEIKGYLGNPNSQNFNFNSFVSKSTTTLLGTAGYAGYLQLLSPSTNLFQETMGNALNGVVKGFFNGVLGGSSTAQPITLTINSKIKLDGSLVTNGGITNKKLVLPGQLNSQSADGNVPNYNSVLGVMNISNKPTVYRTIQQLQTGPYEDPQYAGSYYYETYYEGTFSLNTNSYSILWNPSVINQTTNGASIENLKTQIIHLHMPFDPLTGYGGFVAVDYPDQVTYASNKIGALNGHFSQIEEVGNFAAVSSIPNATTPLTLFN